jgi:hypothetical protein
MTSQLQLQLEADGRILTVSATGTLNREDYERFVPEFERLIKQHGKIRVLFVMSDFRGWDAGALWEDLKFDFRHFNDIERLAMVGDKAWEQGMSLFCKPFTTAKVRYFDEAQIDEARQWLREGLPTT